MADTDLELLVLVEQDEARRASYADVAEGEGWQTQTAASIADAGEAVHARSDDSTSAILLGSGTGDDLCAMVAKLRADAPRAAIIVASSSKSPHLAVEVLRAGAADVLMPPASPARLKRALDGVRRQSSFQLASDTQQGQAAPILDFDAMVGADARFRTALAKAATAARGHGHMLVEGERGTGKRTLLTAVHNGSARTKSPLRIVECEGKPTNSVQSEIFGHEKGAFPGAFDRRDGALASCDGGTVLLDAIDTLDRDTQDRLAETLRDGIVRPTGGSHGFRIDVRVLASSRRPLEVLVDDGRFSRNLYAALSTTRVALPPLRERAGDIPALTRHFLTSFGEIDGMSHHSIADSALSLLETYDWPGNIRQLQSILFRACVQEQREALTAHSFPLLSELVGDATRGESRTRGLGVLLYQDDGHIRTLEDIEGDIIRLAIGKYRGKMTEVARRLGIGRSTLYRKLHDLGIDNAA